MMALSLFLSKQKEVKHKMGGVISLIYSGAVEAAAGTVISGTISSLARTYEMQNRLDMTLYSLEQEVIKIQCAINAARRRRITDQTLLQWLAKLIDAAYLGDYYHQTFKNQNSLPSKVPSEGTSNLAILPSNRAAKRQRTIKTMFLGDDEIRKLHDILKMLRSIDMNTFLLMVNAQPEKPVRSNWYLDDNRLLNRNKERGEVMNFLFEPSKVGENNVNILPIVGSWGVGKTSLALHCLHDPKVEMHFSLKIYISSTYIGFSRTMEDILVQCNSAYRTNYDDENTLQAMLKQNLSSKKFVLIIDNVLCVDSMFWSALCECLRCGKEGSKVIFIIHTTVYNTYRKIINPENQKPIMLNGFSEEEYISFFEQHAFGSANPEDFPELVKLGWKIAKKMNGSIWGAKILGELLRDNLNVPFWSNFSRDSFLNSGFQPIMKTIMRLLPKRLELKVVWFDIQSQSNELKSLRELMILDPDESRSGMRGKNNFLELLVSKHVLLNECTVITAISKPDNDD
jgi:NB-ARC domain